MNKSKIQSFAYNSDQRVYNVSTVLCTNVKSWHNVCKSGHDFDGTCALFKVSFFMF